MNRDPNCTDCRYLTTGACWRHTTNIVVTVPPSPFVQAQPADNVRPIKALMLLFYALFLFTAVCGCDSPPTSDAGTIEEAVLHPLPIHPCQVPRYSVLTETRCRGWEACAACIVSSPTHTQTMAACVSPTGNLCVASCGECYAPFTVLP